MSKQAKFSEGGCFSFFGGSRGKFPLRRFAKELSRLRRAVPRRVPPKIKKEGYFTAIKPPNAV